MNIEEKYAAVLSRVGESTKKLVKAALWNAYLNGRLDAVTEENKRIREEMRDAMGRRVQQVEEQGL